jgi:hypothetical protein
MKQIGFIGQFGYQALPFLAGGGGGGALEWLLAAGAWNDTGVWDDAAVWKDTL